MDPRELLVDAVRRPLDTASIVLRGISLPVLNTIPTLRGEAGRTASIAWLLWHAGRQMDLQVAELRGAATLWEREGWASRLGLPREADDLGFDDIPRQVDCLQVNDPAALEAHLTACVEDYVAYVQGLAPEDLDEVIDESWAMPVTRGVRLVSIIDDTVAHLGQAAYARRLLEDWPHED